HRDDRVDNRFTAFLVKDAAGVVDPLRFWLVVGRLLLAWLLLVAVRKGGIKPEDGNGRDQEANAKSAGSAPQLPAALFERLLGVEQHDDSPVQAGAPVADAQRLRYRVSKTQTRETDEKCRVILHLPCLFDSAGICKVILAQPQLTSQPPEEGLIEEEDLRQRGRIPRPDVAPLDVRPLVGQTI